jgi:serine-type D-Ala-D-Ala carboxypeptidase (penicillin-binding protein 5/6)
MQRFFSGAKGSCDSAGHLTRPDRFHSPYKIGLHLELGAEIERTLNLKPGTRVAYLPPIVTMGGFNEMRMIRYLFLATFVAAASLPSAVRAQAPAAAYSIVDATSGFPLEASNPRKKLQVASLTKIATAMVVLDWAQTSHADLNELITVPETAEALNSADEGVGFHAGDRCSMRDLLYAALMQSDNQAAETLAHHVGAAIGGGDAGAMTAFVAQMNALAHHNLGMKDTLFLNAHGLDSLERKLPFSTAQDMAILTKYALEHPAFQFFVSQRERKITTYSGVTNAPASYLLRNTNELLGVDGIDGVKTGATGHAGQCVIVSSARPPESRQQGDQVMITPRRLIVVVLGAQDRFAFARQMLAHGWQLYDKWAAAGRPMKGWRPR